MWVCSETGGDVRVLMVQMSHQGPEAIKVISLEFRTIRAAGSVAWPAWS